MEKRCSNYNIIFLTKDKRRKFCSLSCASVFNNTNGITGMKGKKHTKETIQDMSENRQGQHKGNKFGWKKGKTKCNGYWMIYKPEHPKANSMGKGYVRQNRLVMEEFLGRYLNENEVIHHVNGIKDDDRIENLVIMLKQEHLSLHHKEMVKNRTRDDKGRFIK